MRRLINKRQPIINDDTFLCVRAPGSDKLVVLPQVSVSWLHWIVDENCHMRVSGEVGHMRIFDQLPVYREPGDFYLELRANRCGDHAHISDFDIIVLMMEHCVVSAKQIIDPVSTQPPPAVVIMNADVIGKLTMLDLKADDYGANQ